VALVLTGSMALLRIALLPWTGEIAPYALVFVSVAAAAVLAGWRSGLVAMLAGQSLTWFLVVTPRWTAPPLDQHQVGGLLLATFAQLMALIIITLYQREVDRAWSRREAQVDLLHQALAEIDHRTLNNYQTVLSLIVAQARHSDPPVKEALQQVADRIKAIALASKQLALSSDSLEQVRMTHHLDELCAQIRQGLSRPGIRLECQFDDVRLDAEQAIAISILVNELVTNALKHAFPGDRSGEIRVSLGKASKGLLLEVTDDGIGMKNGIKSRGSGLGTRLVDTFSKQLQARHEIQTGEGGTRHRIHFAADG
jgi:two-component sensor histidine kinase